MAVKQYDGNDPVFLAAYAKARQEGSLSLPERPTQRQYKKFLRGRGQAYQIGFRVKASEIR